MAWEILAGGIVIGVALLGIAFVCDELSEEEKRRQEQMRRDYDNYQEEKRREYQEQCHYYEQRRADERAQRAEELATYRREMMEKRKQKNRPLYDRFLSQLEQQREEKAKLLNECIDILQKCEKSIEEQQHSYVRIKSVKTVAVSLQESISKLKSYLLYLDAYKTHLKYIFDVSGELTEPFSMTLPSDYPYEGKVVYLTNGRQALPIVHCLGKTRLWGKRNTSGLISTKFSHFNLPALKAEIGFFLSLKDS